MDGTQGREMIYLVVDIFLVACAVASVVYMAWPQSKPTPPEKKHAWRDDPTNDYQVFR